MRWRKLNKKLGNRLYFAGVIITIIAMFCGYSIPQVVMFVIGFVLLLAGYVV